jgi:hypothetical protein
MLGGYPVDFTGKFRQIANIIGVIGEIAMMGIALFLFEKGKVLMGRRRNQLASAAIVESSFPIGVQTRAIGSMTKVAYHGALT